MSVKNEQSRYYSNTLIAPPLDLEGATSLLGEQEVREDGAIYCNNAIRTA